DQIIHSGADGLTGLFFQPTPTVLIAEWRRVVNRRAQLIEDVIGVDSNIVCPAGDDPRGELVAGQGLDFVRGRDGVGAAFVTLRFAVFDGEDRNVDRDVVAFEQIKLEMNQLRPVAFVRELEPVHAAFGQAVDGQVRLLRVRRRAPRRL